MPSHPRTRASSGTISRFARTAAIGSGRASRYAPAPMPGRLPSATALLALVLAAPPALRAAPLPDPPELRTWVEQLKTSPQGPFQAIRWYCSDGTVHPARPYPCGNRGGGVQHGERSSRVAQMRDGGYAIANVLSTLNVDRYTGRAPDTDALGQLLIERFLIRVDDGWIFRGARTYRGALQVEDEEAGARRLLIAMLADPYWRTPDRFAFVREAARQLPLQPDDASAASVR